MAPQLKLCGLGVVWVVCLPLLSVSAGVGGSLGYLERSFPLNQKTTLQMGVPHVWTLDPPPNASIRNVLIHPVSP